MFPSKVIGLKRGFTEKQLTRFQRIQRLCVEVTWAQVVDTSKSILDQLTLQHQEKPETIFAGE